MKCRVVESESNEDGEYCCESPTLLTDILRDEWGFEGFTVSDFVAGVRSTKKAIEAGMDLEMPVPTYYGHSLLEAAEKSMALIRNAGRVLPLDKGVKRVLVAGRLADRPVTGKV